MEEKKPWEIAAEETSSEVERKPWEIAAEEAEPVKKKEPTGLESTLGGESGVSATPLMMKKAAQEPKIETWKDVAQVKAPEKKPITEFGKVGQQATKVSEQIYADKSQGRDLLEKRVDVVSKLAQESAKKAEQLSLQVANFDTALNGLEQTYKQTPTPEIKQQFDDLVAKRNDVGKQLNLELLRQKGYSERLAQTQQSIEAIPEGALESMGGSLNNMAVQIKQAIPQTKLSVSQLQQRLGAGMIKAYLRLTDADLSDQELNDIALNSTGAMMAQRGVGGLIGLGDPDQIAKETFARLDELQKEMKPTKGLIETFEQRDLPGFGAAVFDAATSLISSAAVSVPTGGVGLYTTMIGDAIYNYNTERAKLLGISTDELYSKNLDEVATPAVVGAIGASLERIGLKGVENAINTQIAKKGIKELSKLFYEGGKEGLTEWLQTGAETYNEAVGQGQTPEQAAVTMWDKMNSREGYEAALKGIAGSGASIVTGKAAKRIWKSMNPSSQRNIQPVVERAAALGSEVENPTITNEQAADLESQVESLTEQVTAQAVSDFEAVQNMPDDVRVNVDVLEVQAGNIEAEIEKKNKLLENPTISEQARGIIQEEVKVLGEQREKLISDIGNIVENYRKPIMQVFTSPTDERYGFINRGDGNGIVTLTKEEYLRESGDSGIQEPMAAGEEKVAATGVTEVAAEPGQVVGQVSGQEPGQKVGQEVDRKENIRKQAKEEILKVLDDDNLTEQQKEEKISQIVSAAKVQMNLKESDLKQPTIKFEVPTFTVEVSKPFLKTLNELGYSDAQVSNMTIDQQWDIVNNKIQAPEVVSSAKVDSVKENKRQERIAEMQRELDEPVPVPVKQEKQVVSEEAAKIPDSDEVTQELLTQKPKEDAKEQQSREMRGESKPVEAQGQRDSDMPKVNQAELPDGKAAEEKVKEPAKPEAEKEGTAKTQTDEKRNQEAQGREEGLLTGQQPTKTGESEPVSSAPLEEPKFRTALERANWLRENRPEEVPTEKEWLQFVADYSQDEGEIIDEYLREKQRHYETTDESGYNEFTEAMLSIKASQADWNRYVDRRRMSGSIALNHIKRGGKNAKNTLDKDLMEHDSGLLEGITPDEWGEWILDYYRPQNKGVRIMKKSPGQRKLEDAFYEKFGKVLNNKYIENYLDRNLSEKIGPRAKKILTELEAKTYEEAEQWFYDQIKSGAIALDADAPTRVVERIEKDRKREKERAESKRKAEETRQLIEPKNAVDVAKIFNRVFGFTPWESGVAARLFDAKATAFAKAKGISKEEYYKQYWFGGGIEGGLKQIIGENANLTYPIKQNLEVAKEMELSGKSSEVIYLATGWERGVDGLWRYDILDGDGIEDSELLNAIKSSRGGIVEFDIEDVVFNKELFDLYPELKKIKILFSYNEKNPTSATFYKGRNQITMQVGESAFGEGGINRPSSILRHEIQHAIQYLEGFSRGSNLRDAYKIALNQAKIDLSNNEEFNALPEEEKELFFGNYLKNKYGLLDFKNIDYTLYERVAGEVEARNVQNRRELSLEQRKTTPISKTEDFLRKFQILIDPKSKLFQDVKGSWSKEVAYAKRLISMYKNANSTTAVHEILGHDYLDRIVEAVGLGDKQSIDDLNTIVDEYLKENKKRGVTRSAAMKAIKEFNVETNKTELGTSIHEWFAEQAQQYFANGDNLKPEIANTKLGRLFEKFRQHVADLYQAMNKALVPPSPQMKKVFRRLFGEENFEALEHNEKIVEQAKEDINNVKPSGELDDILGGIKPKKPKLYSEEMTDEERILKAGQMMLDKNLTDKYNIVKDIKARLFAIHGNKDSWLLVDELEGDLVSMDKPGEGKLYNATIERLLQDPNVSSETKEKLRAKEIRERDRYSLLKKIQEDADFVTLVGPETVADMLIEEGPKDDSQMDDDSFVRMAQVVVKRLNAMKRGMSIEDKARLTEKSVRIADLMAQKGSEASKTLNSFRAWNMLDKDGMMLRIRKKWDEDNKDKKKKARSKAKQFQKDYEKMKAEYDAMFESLLESEEVAGSLREELAELDKKIEELEKAKARRGQRENTAKPGVKEGNRVTTSVKPESVKNFLAIKLGKKLGQDELTDAEVYEFGASLMDKRRDFTHFVKEFNKATGENYSPKELKDFYLGAVDVMTENGYQGGFSTPAEISEVVTDFEIEKDAAEAIAKRDILKKQEAMLKELAQQQRKALIEDVGAQINSRGLWGKYIDSVTGELTSKVASLLSQWGAADKALLDEFTSLVANAIKEKLEEVLPANKQPKTPKTAQELSEMIADLAKNEEKFAEVFDAMVDKLQEKYANDINKITALQALANIQNPFSDKLLSRAMDLALKNTGWEKGDLAFGRGSVLLGKNLAYTIMNQGGLIGTPYESVVGPLLEKAFESGIKKFEDKKIESLANYIINDAKKAIGAVAPKSVTFVDELINALKKVAREEYKAKNKPVPSDPIDLIKFALENLGEAERIGESVMDRAKNMLSAKIMADPNMTNTQKTEAIRFLNQLTNSIFDTIVPQSTMERAITKAIKASGVFVDGNGNIMWERIITDINGGVDVVKGIIDDNLRAELGNNYSPALVDAALTRIAEKYESMLDEKRQELFEKQLSSLSSSLFKSIVKDRRIGGMVGKLIAMSKSGMLDYAQFYDLISEYLGLNELTAQEWSELEALLQEVEDAPEGFERITALEDATLYLESKMPGYGFKVYWAIKYANMLGGISTFVKNATGTADMIFTALGRTMTEADLNYIKLALKGLKQGDFLDIIKRGSANQGDRVEMPQDSMGLVSVNTLERWRKTPGYRPVKRIFGTLVAVPRVLGGTDAAVQRGASEATDYYLTKRKLKFENPSLSRQALRAAALSSMFDGNVTFAQAIAQAVKEMNQRGIRANLQDILADLTRPVVLQDKMTIRARRRAYEILRKGRDKVVTELSGRDALKTAFKSEFKDNLGLGTGAGWFIQGTFDALEKILSYAIGGGKPSARTKLAVKQPQKMIMPIIRGIANFTEVSFEKFLPYGLLKGGAKYAKYKYFKEGLSEEEKLLFEFKKMQAKDMMFSAMLANAITFLVIETIMAGVDDDDELPNGYYGAGTYKKKNGKPIVIPQNSVVIGGHVFPMAYFGSMAFSLSALGSYNAQKENEDFDYFDFTTNMFTGLLSASMFESFTRIFDVFKPTFNQQKEGMLDRTGEYALNLLTNEVANTVMPWSSMQRQLYQGGKMALSDHDIDLAIGFQEKVVKSMPLLNLIQGLSYSRPDIDYVGDPIPGNLKYPEGAAGFFGMVRSMDIPTYKAYDNKIGLNVPYEGKTLDNIVSKEVMTDEMYYDYKRDVANAFKPYQENHFKSRFSVPRTEPTTDDGDISSMTREKQKQISLAMYGKSYSKLNAQERGNVNQGLNYRNESEAVHSAIESYYRSVYMNGMKMKSNTEKKFYDLVDVIYSTMPDGNSYEQAEIMANRMIGVSRRKSLEK